MCCSPADSSHSTTALRKSRSARITSGLCCRFPIFQDPSLPPPSPLAPHQGFRIYALTQAAQRRLANCVFAGGWARHHSLPHFFLLSFLSSRSRFPWATWWTHVPTSLATFSILFVADMKSCSASSNFLVASSHFRVYLPRHSLWPLLSSFSLPPASGLLRHSSWLPWSSLFQPRAPRGAFRPNPVSSCLTLLFHDYSVLSAVFLTVDTRQPTFPDDHRSTLDTFSGSFSWRSVMGSNILCTSSIPDMTSFVSLLSVFFFQSALLHPSLSLHPSSALLRCRTRNADVLSYCLYFV